jgi:hypothetical protein
MCLGFRVKFCFRILCRVHRQWLQGHLSSKIAICLDAIDVHLHAVTCRGVSTFSCPSITAQHFLVLTAISLQFVFLFCTRF